MILLFFIVCIYISYTFEGKEHFENLNEGQIAGLSIGSVFLIGLVLFGLYVRHEWIKLQPLRQYFHF
jgi:hypothetical protein